MLYYSRKKRLKKIFIIATILAAVAFISSRYLLSDSSNDLLVAQINGQKIFKSEIDNKLNDIFSSKNKNVKTPQIDHLPKQVFEILIKEIYVEKELIRKAGKSKISRSKEVRDRIEDSKNKILRENYLDQLIKREVTEKKINGKYLELTNKLAGKKEYLIYHILSKSEKESKKIRKKLKSKKSSLEKFSKLAKKHSIDKESADKGGNLAYILEDNLIKEILEIVTSLDVGEISMPIKTQFGWHLIRIENTRDAQALPLKEVRDNIEKQLINEFTDKIRDKIIKNAKIEILIPLKTKDSINKEQSSKKKSKTKDDAKKEKPTSQGKTK